MAVGAPHQNGRALVADNGKIIYMYGLKRNDHITQYRVRLNGLTNDHT